MAAMIDVQRFQESVLAQEKESKNHSLQVMVSTGIVGLVCTLGFTIKTQVIVSTVDHNHFSTESLINQDNPESEDYFSKNAPCNPDQCPEDFSPSV